MKLNGWIRLWIVLSIFWVTFSGYSAYTDLSALYKTKIYEASKDEVGKVEYVFSAAQSDSEVNEMLTKDLIPQLQKSPQDFVNKTISTPYDTYLEKNASKEIWAHIKIALLPVIGLFALGWSFVWVRHGFKESKNA